MTKTKLIIDFMVSACGHALRSPYISKFNAYEIGKCNGVIRCCDGEGTLLYQYYMEDLLKLVTEEIYDRSSFLYAYGLDFIIKDGKPG